MQHGPLIGPIPRAVDSAASLARSTDSRPCIWTDGSALPRPAQLTLDHPDSSAHIDTFERTDCTRQALQICRAAEEVPIPDIGMVPTGTTHRGGLKGAATDYQFPMCVSNDAERISINFKAFHKSIPHGQIYYI